MAKICDPPRSLRVVHLRDRLVLHDTTFALRGGDPSARNALIDAANQVNGRLHSSVPASRLTPPPGHTPSPSTRYLVFPRVPPGGLLAPFRAHTPAEAGLGPSGADPAAVLGVESAAGLLGVLQLVGGVYVVLVSSVRRAGEVPEGPVFAAAKVRMIRIGGFGAKADDKLGGAILKVLESGHLYYALDADLTRARQKGEFAGDDAVVGGGGGAFWWTWPMVAGWGPEVQAWTLRTVYGFLSTVSMSVHGSTLVRQGGSSASLPPVPEPRLRGRRRTQALIDMGEPADRFGPSRRGPNGLSESLNGNVRVENEFQLTLISRRSRRRAGTRFITRGVDAMGDVANFVETEQVVWRKGSSTASSFLVARGSIPVFWRQNNGIARPSPELDASLRHSSIAFRKHFGKMCRSYGNMVAISLVDQRGSEGVLAEAFEKHIELEKAAGRSKRVRLVSFDFHAMCAGKEYERGLASLMAIIRGDLNRFGIFSEGVGLAMDTRQTGIFRVNCVDCLDRTNVVQSMLARQALDAQVQVVFFDGREKSDNLRLYAMSEDRFKHIWGDNADAISKQYSGTGALKTDFTRTGKRSTSGVIGDGVKSVVRMYYKNFIDEGRQEAIDIMCGYAKVKQPAEPSKSHPLIDLPGASEKVGQASKSFAAMRMNAGGDRQQVSIELDNSVMSLSSAEGIQFTYPRDLLTSWEKCVDPYQKVSSTTRQSARLRLMHESDNSSPGTASPLDLVFREGSRPRERFLRSYLGWASPSALELAQQPIRVRILASPVAGKHTMADWGLDPSRTNRKKADVVALMLPKTDGAARSWGLAAVPVDVEDSDYELVSARAVGDEGPAIAILVSKSILSAVTAINESVFAGDRSFSAGKGRNNYEDSRANNGRLNSKRNVLRGNGKAVGVVLTLVSTTFCFVSAKLSDAADLWMALTSLKLGKQPHDVTNQFHYLYVGGLLGASPWRKGNGVRAGYEWVKLSDGSRACSLPNNLSILRNSFPTLVYDDLSPEAPRLSSHAPVSLSTQSLQSICLSDEKIYSTKPKTAILSAMPVSNAQGRTASAMRMHCLVVLSNLRAKELKVPPGFDPSIGLNAYLAMTAFNVLSGDGATKPTTRPTDSPQWFENITFCTTDKTTMEDVVSEFVLAAVMVATPLGDDVAVGCAVIPLQDINDEGKGTFNVVLRLGGIVMGRLLGEIEMKWSEEAARGWGVNEAHELVDNSVFPDEESRMERGRKSGLAESFSAMKDGLNINETRRKGSKQLKAMVGRLSSYFGSSGGNGRYEGRSRTGARMDAFQSQDAIRALDRSNRSTGQFLEGSEVSNKYAAPETRAHAADQNKDLVEEDDDSFTAFQTAAPANEDPGHDLLIDGLSKERQRGLSMEYRGDPLLQRLESRRLGDAPSNLVEDMGNLALRGHEQNFSVVNGGEKLDSFSRRTRADQPGARKNRDGTSAQGGKTNSATGLLIDF